MSRRLSLAVTLVFLVLMGGAVWMAQELNAEARRIPLVVGIPTLVLLFIQTIRDVRKARRATSVIASPGSHGAGSNDAEIPDGTLLESQPPAENGGEDGVVFSGEGAVIGTAGALAWVAASGVAFLLIGMLGAAAAFVFAFVKVYGNEGWIKSIAIAAGTTAVVYFGFQELLGLKLYDGILLRG